MLLKKKTTQDLKWTGLMLVSWILEHIIIKSPARNQSEIFIAHCSTVMHSMVPPNNKPDYKL